MTTHLAYGFPLRSDFLAQLVVPIDLTTVEAQRLTTFLLTIAGDVPTVERLTGPLVSVEAPEPREAVSVAPGSTEPRSR